MTSDNDSEAPAQGAVRVIDLQQSVDALREGIQILSPDWRYLYVNRAAAEHGRSSVENLLGRSMLECYPGIEKTHVFSVLERCMRERQSEQLENEFEYADGQRTWFELRIHACPEGLFVLSLDVTQRKRLEANLRHGEKMRALGQLAAGVAHDLKNIFNPIMLSAQLVGQRLRADPELAPLLHRIQQAAQVGADTVERLRSFSRSEVEREPEPVDLRRIADAALEMCAPRIQRAPRIRVERIHEPAPQVFVRSAELVTALVNLLVNAFEATSDTGTISVRTGTVDGGGVIEIDDHGPGIAPEVESRMFEAFFTTKRDGTGLGLAMVSDFVQRHNGRIAVDTAPGRGTRIQLWFPPYETTALSRPRQRLGHGGRRLLLVEDEAISRMALEVLLQNEGFNVLAVASGEEAISDLGDFTPELLLVDFGLPGIDGAAVAQHLRASNPGLPVVVMTGFDTLPPALRALLDQGRCMRVAKPINFDRALMMMIDELLGGVTPPGPEPADAVRRA